MNYNEACVQLGLESNLELTDASLKKAFKKAALKHHPDKNLNDAEQAKETFQRISTAYEFLNECVTRGQTGPNRPRFATSDNPLFEGDGEDPYHAAYEYYDDEDDDAEYVDIEELLYSMLFAKMHGGGGGRGGHGYAGPGFAFGMGGNSAFGGGGHRASHHSPHSTSHYHYRATPGQRHSYSGDGFYDDYDYDYNDDDDDFEEMFDAYAERARRKEEARQAAQKREKEHAKYMAERARQAELEGRDFFESWNVKQLMGECQRRGIATKGKQQKDIVEALIQDEAKKRLRTQLKEEAPLLDEWVEVIGMKKNDHWNGMKVRAIDYFGDLDKYEVEWDMNASKKKTKGYMRESKKARIKPENLRLWGTGEPSGDTSAAASTGSDKENTTKQQESQQKSSKKKSKNKNQNDNNGNVGGAKKEAPKSKSNVEPEVPKTKCCAICHKEHNLQADDAETKAKMTVLPCAHIFCMDCCGGSYLPDSTSTVEIRSCRVCHKTDPGMEALKTLPYVADLQDPPEALLESLYKEYSLIVTCESAEALEKKQENEVQALDVQKAKALKEQKDAIQNKADNGKMNKDKKGKLVKQVQASVEAEFGPKRKDLGRKHQQLWRSVAKTGTLKEVHEQRDAATEEVTTAINKHYRRASIKVHPDRHGDKFEKEFDALTKAKNTLSDADLRHSYMEQMLEVVCSVGTHWMPSAHKTWVEKHQPGMAEQNPSTKKSDAPGNQAPRQIEGGLMHSTPRRPNVAILNTKERRVRVTLRIPGSSYEFYSKATAVHIKGDRADLYNEFDEEYTKTVFREAYISKCDGEIEVDVTFPEAGLWDIRWMYTIEMEPGCTHDSEPSTDTRVDLVSPKFKAQLKVMKSFESVAARRVIEIQAALRKLKSSARNHSTIENRYETLQEAILKAKHAEFHLEKAMKTVGANLTATESPLARLRSSLAGTRPYKEELDKAMIAHEKKVAYKNFKQGVYNILETGEGSSWVALVTEETLKDEMKGDANRLYQLLMEGKKAYNLELVDAATLCVAADRKDLFSAKQLKALSERSEQVEIRAAEEARRMMIDLEKKESAEKALHSLQQKAASMDCERGDLVQITGLKSEPALNGRLATYMGLGQGERFNLLLDEGREIALRKQNFHKYDGVSVVSLGPVQTKEEKWTCKTCTYLHKGPHVDRLTACSMCGTSREGNRDQGQTATAMDRWTCGQCTFVNEGADSDCTMCGTSRHEEGARENSPKISPQPRPPSQPRPKSTPSQTSTGKTSLPAQKTAHTPIPKTVLEAFSKPETTVAAKQEAKTTKTSAGTAKKRTETVINQQGVDLSKYAAAPAKPSEVPVKAKKVAPRQPKSHSYETSEPQSTKPARAQKHRVPGQGSLRNAPSTQPSSTQNVKDAAVTDPQDPPKVQAPIAKSDVKPATKKKATPRCKFGKKCTKLKKGKCKFEHSAEELALVKPKTPPGDASPAKKSALRKEAPATPATVAESLSTRHAADTKSEKTIDMTVLVNSEAAGFVIGAKARNLKKIAHTTGAEVSVAGRSSNSHGDGMCHIRIRASSQAIIEKAAHMIHESVDKFETSKATSKGKSVASGGKTVDKRDVPSAESSSISTVPSVINGGSMHPKPAAKMTSFSANSDLRAFLESHANALKCTPYDFSKWLREVDVETLSDLCEAIEDEFFVEELLQAGLKRFKMGAFLQSIKSVLGTTATAMP